VNNFLIKAASRVSLEGSGNDLTGFKPWPPAISEKVQKGAFDEADWCDFFTTDPGRFGRMDPMCRLGLMTVELLQAGFESLPDQDRQEVGVCLQTTTGSVSTDSKFIATPRASLFAYTLPSTALGELCIRHRLRGPMMCLMSGETGESALAQALRWLDKHEARHCLCLQCDALEPESLDHLQPPKLWPSRLWQASALLLGPDSNTPRQHAVSENSIVANALRLVP
jgi:3-oxoacyl-(acyl-carrier-protein) synthase